MKVDIGIFMRIRKSYVNLLLAFVSIFFTYIILEITYRGYLYYSYSHKQYEIGFMKNDFNIYDFNTGYKHLPMTDLLITYYGANDQHLKDVRIITNNQGHVSFDNDTLEKPSSEFRIAVVGDSFTECANINWPDRLNDILNGDCNLKKLLNVSRFKVINFGRSGTGIVQFAKIYEHEIIDYYPDLVIVSFISGDIIRKFCWAAPSKIGNLGIGLFCPSLPVQLGKRDCMISQSVVLDRDYLRDKEIRKAARDTLSREIAKNLPWFSPYPEILARVVGNKLKKPLGLVLKPRLKINFSNWLYEDSREAVETSAQALKSITSRQKNTLLLYNPTSLNDEIYREIFDNQASPLVSGLEKSIAPLNIVHVTKYMDHRQDRQEINKWFIYDHHFSEYGTQIYAEAIHKYLAADWVKNFLSSRASIAQ